MAKKQNNMFSFPSKKAMFKNAKLRADNKAKAEINKRYENHEFDNYTDEQIYEVYESLKRKIYVEKERPTVIRDYKRAYTKFKVLSAMGLLTLSTFLGIGTKKLLSGSSQVQETPEAIEWEAIPESQEVSPSNSHKDFVDTYKVDEVEIASFENESSNSYQYDLQAQYDNLLNSLLEKYNEQTGKNLTIDNLKYGESLESIYLSKDDEGNLMFDNRSGNYINPYSSKTDIVIDGIDNNVICGILEIVYKEGEQPQYECLSNVRGVTIKSGDTYSSNPNLSYVTTEQLQNEDENVIFPNIDERLFRACQYHVKENENLKNNSDDLEL